MSVTHTLHQNWVNGSRAIASKKDYTGNAQLTIDETIANDLTDHPIALTLDVSAIKSIYILSDRDISFQTNNAATPDDTLALIAGHPYIWNTDSLFTNLLTTDITSLFITNTSGGTASLKLEVVYDPTP